MGIKLNEHQEQSLLCQYLELKGIEYFSIPNGFNLNISKFETAENKGKKYGQLNKLKKEGMKEGVPYLFIYSLCLFIEMKTKKGKLSKEQMKFRDDLKKYGYNVEKANGYDEARLIVDKYLDDCNTGFNLFCMLSKDKNLDISKYPQMDKEYIRKRLQDMLKELDS